MVEAIAREYCAFGRLARSYPVAAHDIELRADAPFPAVLRAAAAEAIAADPRCRRVVYAVPVGDAGGAALAAEAGFRHVVDVELIDEELELWVVEPDWVTRTDMDLDRVPGS